MRAGWLICGSVTYRWPPTPVCMTVIEDPACAPVSPDTYLSASLLMAPASSSPAFPVRVLAHPELTMTPLSPCPLVFLTISLVTVIDAAGNSFFVSTAAPHEGLSDATRTKSGWSLLAGFRPTFVLPTRNPCGYVPDIGTSLCFLAGTSEFPSTSNLDNQRIWRWTGLAHTSVATNRHVKSAILGCLASPQLAVRC